MTLIRDSLTCDDLESARESFDELLERVEELRTFFRDALAPHEYDRFRRSVLGHLEPALTEEHAWVVGPGASSIESYLRDVEEELDGREEEERELEAERTALARFAGKEGGSEGGGDAG
jgi:hypothetical protein